MPVFEVIRQLPEIAVVRDRSWAMAVLDAIMSPDRESRYYSFDSRWSPTEEMASMDDGEGNEYSIAFSPAGAYARGFDHESPVSPYRVTPLAPWPGPSSAKSWRASDTPGPSWRCHRRSRRRQLGICALRQKQQ